MDTELLHVGFGNYIALGRVVAIVSPGSAPIQRKIREGKKIRWRDGLQAIWTLLKYRLWQPLCPPVDPNIPRR